jgi:hypothetical protein
MIPLNPSKLPDGSQVVPWSASGGKLRALLLVDASWELADLRRWRGELDVMTDLRARLADDLVAPNLTRGSDHGALTQVSQFFQDGFLIRSRDGVQERRASSVVSEKSAPPPPAAKPQPPSRPLPPPPPPLVIATLGVQATAMVKAAEEGAPFYCDCPDCQKNAS